MDPEEIKREFEAIRAALSGETAERFETLRTEIGAVQSELQTLRQTGAEPKDQKVQEAEARLTAIEASVQEIREQVRLANAKPVIPAQENRWEEAFRGTLLRNFEGLRRAIRETRALDSTLIATAGKLPAQAAEQFIDFVIAQQAGLSRATVLRMNSPQGVTDELRVSSRKLRKATEGTAPSVADSVTTKRRTLTTVEGIWAEDITLTLLEDAIERRGTEGHIARLLAIAIGNDFNDLAWNGDEDSSNAFLSINDGWITLALADSDVNDVTSYASAIDKASEVLALMWKSVPAKFMGRTDYAYYVPVELAQNYAEEVSARETALGDNVTVNGFPNLRYFGRPVIPETHLSASDRYAMLTPTANLHFGIQRAITIDSEWNARKRVVEYTITARTDYEYATGEAIVLASSIPTALLA